MVSYLQENYEVFIMKISTRGRYAIRMFLDLAEHKNEGFVALKDIAERQNISKKYLEQIISVFNNPSFLKSTRGVSGGYMLAREANEYSIGEILRMSEGSLAPIFCVENESEDCSRSGDCVMRPLWQGLNKVINDYLNNITLQNLLDQNININ